MKECSLPTRRQCLELMDELGVPLHIRKHSLAVARLGVFLAKKLKEKGISVDVDLVDRACLLHDILRICDLKESGYDRSWQAITDKDRAKWRQLRARYRNLCHEDAAFALLRDAYPELALAVKRHRYAALLDEKDKPVTWEEKIVYYADKRVMHDKIVPLKERLEEAHRRNAAQRNCANQAKLNTERIDAAIFELERQILDKIGLETREVTAGRNISRTGKLSGTHGT
ncbi:MAG: HD domain-containing protein [Sedimentisphaerales bacterium]|nr:HD domain-containing protein [Sedimentisphaerales bacterium]